LAAINNYLIAISHALIPDEKTFESYNAMKNEIGNADNSNESDFVANLASGIAAGDNFGNLINQATQSMGNGTLDMGSLTGMLSGMVENSGSEMPPQFVELFGQLKNIGNGNFDPRILSNGMRVMADFIDQKAPGPAESGLALEDKPRENLTDEID
jgi:hypothetical protein